MYERYATGQESDRTIAEWLNARGVRSARGRAFGKDTVREMLVNAAYAGYVTGLRGKDRSLRGLHEPIISDELFESGPAGPQLARPGRQGGPAVAGLRPAQAPVLRALRPAHARHSRQPRRNPPLPVLHPPPRR